MAKIQIVTDAGADLTKEEMQKYNVDVLPIKIIAKDKEYLSGVNMFSDEFYELLKNCDEIPHTSQPSTAEIYDLLVKHIKEGKEVLALTISSKASGLNNNMHLAKNMILEEYPDAVIEIFDTMHLSYTYGWPVLIAAELAEEGKESPEILEAVKKHIEEHDVYFIPQSLTYLEKGGRINKASLVFGNVLDIVPVLTLKDGLVESIGKLRGRKKLAKKLFQYLCDNAPDQSGNELLIINGNMDTECDELEELLKEKYGDIKIRYAKVGATIATHIGPVFAIYFKK